MLFGGSEESLINAGGLWSIILPSLACKKVRGQRRIYSSMMAQDRLGDTNLQLLTVISDPQGGEEEQKNWVNNRRLVNAAMSGLPVKIFLVILVIAFVGAGKCTFRSSFLVLHAGNVLRTLDGWKISACLHILQSRFSYSTEVDANLSLHIYTQLNRLPCLQLRRCRDCEIYILSDRIDVKFWNVPCDRG